MSIVAIDKPTLISLALAAALPMLPVILLTTPVDEIVHAVLKMLKMLKMLGWWRHAARFDSNDRIAVLFIDR